MQFVPTSFHQTFLRLTTVLQIVFKYTAFSYKNYIFIILYTFVIIGYFIVAALSFAAHSDVYLVVYELGSKSNLYMKAAEATNFNMITFLTSVLVAIWQIAMSIICLYMFSTRLVKLNKTLIEQYAVEMSRTFSGSANSVVNSDECGSTNEATVVTSDSNQSPKSKPITISKIKKRSKKNKKDGAAHRIMKLHGLIKKHTILVYIDVFTTITFFLLFSVVSPWIVTQFPLFLSISNITVWLMFSCSHKYWKLLRKYCCCYLCYQYSKSSDVYTEETKETQQIEHTEKSEYENDQKTMVVQESNTPNTKQLL